jgi:hypothetical protein
MPRPKRDRRGENEQAAHTYAGDRDARPLHAVREAQPNSRISEQETRSWVEKNGAVRIVRSWKTPEERAFAVAQYRLEQEVRNGEG